MDFGDAGISGLFCGRLEVTVEVVHAPCMIHHLSAHKLQELRPIYSVDMY